MKYEHPSDLHWDDETYQGDAYGAYAWAVYVAEVSVDTRTAEARVDDFVAVQDVGKVINPVLAADRWKAAWRRESVSRCMKTWCGRKGA